MEHLTETPKTKEPWEMTREEFSDKFKSVPDVVINQLGKITIDESHVGEGTWSADRGLSIIGGEDSILHEAGHVIDNVLSDEQSAKWEMIALKMPKGLWGNRLTRHAKDPYYQWEDLYNAFQVFHKKYSGKQLTDREVEVIKERPKVFQFIAENLSNKTPEVLADYPELGPEVSEKEHLTEKQSWQMTKEELKRKYPKISISDLDQLIGDKPITIVPEKFISQQRGITVRGETFGGKIVTTEEEILHELGHIVSGKFGTGDNLKYKLWIKLSEDYPLPQLNKQGKVIKGITSVFSEDADESFAEAYRRYVLDLPMSVKLYKFIEAFSKGKPVPPEVLADYPELVPEVSEKEHLI